MLTMNRTEYNAGSNSEVVSSEKQHVNPTPARFGTHLASSEIVVPMRRPQPQILFFLKNIFYSFWRKKYTAVSKFSETNLLPP
jgi:hypothetical protein